jgi:hypothetical protein
MTATRQDVGTKQQSPFVAGDSRILRFTATEDDGTTLINLTGAAIRWELFPWPSGPKYGVPDETAVVSKAVGSGITITDPAGGIFEVKLDPADTAALLGMHWHEVEAVDADGNVLTSSSGHFLISFQRVV